MEFLIIGLTFLILLLLIVWRPFFKQKTTAISDTRNVRDEMNVRLYHEHKKEIEKDYSEGGIDEENYQYLLSELNSTLLQDVELQDTSLKNEALTDAKSANSDDESDTMLNKNFSPLWPLVLSIFIMVFSIALYNKQGSYKQLTEVPEGHGQQQSMSEEKRLLARQNEAMNHIDKLRLHIESNPTDTEAWYNLGQTYVAIGEFSQAVTAFQQVIVIEGEHADLLGAIAQALYYQNNQTLNSEIQSYIDRALALDINDPSTNILLGMNNFIDGNFQQAINHWQRVIDSNNRGVNIPALKEAIMEAQKRLDPVAEQNNATTNESTNNRVANNEKSADITGPQLKVSVRLSDEIIEKLSQGEDRVVFIYAVPTNGQRMPLAAVKMKASDLPTVVVLNNSQAMSSANTLGSVEKANVYAIVSMQGGVGIKVGDYKAEALAVDVNRKDTLELVVNSIVE